MNRTEMERLFVEEARAATTPTQAFAIAVRAVHYARTLEMQRGRLDSYYDGAVNARRFLTKITGLTVGDASRIYAEGTADHEVQSYVDYMEARHPTDTPDGL